MSGERSVSPSVSAAGIADASSHPPLRRLTSPRRPAVEPRGMERRYQQALEETRLKERGIAGDFSATSSRSDANGNFKVGGLQYGSSASATDDAMDGEILVEKWLQRKSSKKSEVRDSPILAECDGILGATAGFSTSSADDGENKVVIGRKLSGEVMEETSARFHLVDGVKQNSTMVNHSSRSFKINN